MMIPSSILVEHIGSQDMQSYTLATNVGRVVHQLIPIISIVANPPETCFALHPTTFLTHLPKCPMLQSLAFVHHS